MRAVIRAAILGDPVLQSLGVNDSGSVLSGDIDSFEARPFLNLKWGERTAGIKNVSHIVALAIWVHDDPNDYDRIDDICARLRVLLPSLVGLPDVNDYVSQMRWVGEGPDLKDDGHRTITRVSNFLINGM